MIEGLSHLTFIVKDLERGSTFFHTVFDAQQIYSSEENTFSLSREKFFLIGGLWIAVMEGHPLPERTYNHVAFRVHEKDLPLYESRIQALGLDILPPRPRVQGEGRSLYFYDFDNHLFELHSGSLIERLARYSRGSPEAATT